MVGAIQPVEHHAAGLQELIHGTLPGFHRQCHWPTKSKKEIVHTRRKEGNATQRCCGTRYERQRMGMLLAGQMVLLEDE